MTVSLIPDLTQKVFQEALVELMRQNGRAFTEVELAAIFAGFSIGWHFALFAAGVTDELPPTANSRWH